MEMSKEEIVRRYKEAKKKSGMIQILAELNGTSKTEIRKVLTEFGITLPGNPNFGTPQARIKKQIRKEDTMATLLTDTGETINDERETKFKLPKEIRDILEDNLKTVREQIAVLAEKENTIETFLKEHE